MVQPTVLRKRHSLKGMKLLPVIKKVRGGKPEGLKEFARISKEKKTDVLVLDEIENLVNSLTGESMVELLELAGRDVDVDEARWLLHCLIIFANEVGQPRGQALDDSTDPSTSASTGGGSTPVPLETAGPSKKRKHDADTTLEERVLSLEKTSKVEMVQELKEKKMKFAPEVLSFMEVPLWELNSGFNPMNMSIRDQPAWITLEGRIASPATHSPRAEEVINGDLYFDINSLPIRDPGKFISGQIHSFVPEWECIMNKITSKNNDVLKWIKKGVNVFDFFQSYNGNFKGNYYNSNVPPKHYAPKM